MAPLAIDAIEEEGCETTESGGATDTFAALPPSKYGDNTPLNKKRRSSLVPKGVWVHVKRIKCAVIRKEFTHVCLLCWRRLNVTRDRNAGNRFLTTVALRHNAEFHPDEAPSLKRTQREEVKLNNLQASSAAVGEESVSSSSGPRTLAGFFINLKQMALTKAARFYVYGTSHVSKATFECLYFREMQQGYYTAGGGVGKCPLLTIKGLKAYVHAEYRNFLALAKFAINEALVSAEGNPFGQCLHDAATLASHDHVLAIGFNYVDVDLTTNWTLCLSCIPIDKGTDLAVASALNEVFVEVLGYRHSQLAHSTTSDRAAMGVVEDTYACGMHDTDKIGRFAIGDLVRTRKKVPVNSFNEGQAHINELQKLAVYINRNKQRHGRLLALNQAVPGGFARIRPKTDYNGTRVSARRNLVQSMVRLHKGVRLFCASEPDAPGQDVDWEACVEILALLDNSAEVATLSQTEKYFTSALGFLAKERMMDRYRAATMEVVDLPRVTPSPHLPKVRDQRAPQPPPRVQPFRHTQSREMGGLGGGWLPLWFRNFMDMPCTFN